MLLSFKQNFMETTGEYEIIDGYKIPKEEAEMAKIMLTNLPNTCGGIMGFRIYDGKLVMIAERRNNEYSYDCLPVSDIVKFLKTKDISNIKVPENDLVKRMTKIMWEIARKFGRNAFRLYGFDGVYNYLKHEMSKDNNNKDDTYDYVEIADLKRIVIHVSKEERDQYRIRERIPGYNYSYKNCNKLIELKDIAGHINDIREGNKLKPKFCTGCNDPDSPCDFTYDTESLNISFEISDNGEFIDHAPKY